MSFFVAWLLFGLMLLLFDIFAGLAGPGSSVLSTAKQRGPMVAFFWGVGIILGSFALFVVMIITPQSVIKRLPNIGPRRTKAK